MLEATSFSHLVPYARPHLFAGMAEQRGLASFQSVRSRPIILSGPFGMKHRISQVSAPNQPVRVKVFAVTILTLRAYVGG